MIRALSAIALLPLTACMTTEGADRTMPQGPCSADAAQPFIGQPASEETGAALLRATGARELRWVPPRTKVTMDFRPDRLTVYYDDDLIIQRVACT